MLRLALILAATVTITLPDASLRGTLRDIAAWHHACQELPDQEQAACVAAFLVKLLSLGHYQDLRAIGATMTVTMDEAAP